MKPLAYYKYKLTDFFSVRVLFLILLGAILLSNTFSPQYLIWLAPFVAFLDDDEGLIFVLASVLTWVYFRYWDDVVALQPMAITILIARNLLLIMLYLIASIRLFRETKSI